MVSKCSHITGVGFVILPDEKVSAASRKLKSFGMNGLGMGDKGRIARRRRSAVNPITAIDRRFLRARRPKARSMRENPEDARRGQQNATATAIAVREASINRGEAPCSGAEDKTISELFASPLSSYDQV